MLLVILILISGIAMLYICLRPDLDDPQNDPPLEHPAPPEPVADLEPRTEDRDTAEVRAAALGPRHAHPQAPPRCPAARNCCG